jgi:hypothetical protein
MTSIDPLRTAAQEIIKIWQEAPYGVSFGAFMERALGNLSAIIAALPVAPVSHGPSRYMDEIDAATAGSKWLDLIAMALPKHPSNEITCERVGNDGNVRLLWHKDIVQAGFLLIRDDTNFTQLLRFTTAPVLDRAVVIEECAKVADAAQRTFEVLANDLAYSEKFGMQSATDTADRIAKAIRALASIPQVTGKNP